MTEIRNPKFEIRKHHFSFVAAIQDFLMRNSSFPFPVSIFEYRFSSFGHE